MDAGTIIMAAITLASVMVALYTVWDGKARYLHSVQPIISFKLSCSSKHLDLEILNTGKSPAHNVMIHISSIEGLATGYDSKEDNLSDISFDLYPEEVVCNHIARIIDKPSKVLLKLNVSYMDDWDDLEDITRTVFMYNAEEEIMVLDNNSSSK